MASGIVRGGDLIQLCWRIKKLVQSQRIDEMKVFGGTLIARVMESDTELELFDNFCVKYVGAIDKSFKENSFNDQSVLLEPLYWSLGWMPNKPRICYFINFIYLFSCLVFLPFPTCPVPSTNYLESARHS